MVHRIGLATPALLLSMQSSSAGPSIVRYRFAREAVAGHQAATRYCCTIRASL
jgi:hypothetical protein